ncbi:unnamed protein product [Soboliphyme baturini]|uniref:Receptor expression-enhancing protein n=1 Tax=Soboliphyme baturini TaxID=241478 RepID=A0A183J536_9BILA|nr:unnamed protein product [Soboliphyme baturini]
MTPYLPQRRDNRAAVTDQHSITAMTPRGGVTHFGDANMADFTTPRGQKVFYRRRYSGSKRRICTIASSAKTSRENIACAGLDILAVYLSFRYFGEFTCNFIAFPYPAVLSILATESADKNCDTKHLTYCTVFAICSLIDFRSQAIKRWFPHYWLLKCAFFLWLYRPRTDGAQVCYKRLVLPCSRK